jgi:hypothetical protein
VPSARLKRRVERRVKKKENKSITARSPDMAATNSTLFAFDTKSLQRRWRLGKRDKKNSIKPEEENY